MNVRRRAKFLTFENMHYLFFLYLSIKSMWLVNGWQTVDLFELKKLKQRLYFLKEKKTKIVFLTVFVLKANVFTDNF